MANLGIGSTVWIDVGDVRIEWKPFKITGETRVFWGFMFDNWTYARFLKKPDMRGRYMTCTNRYLGIKRRVFVSKADADEYAWIREYSRRIGNAVTACEDAAILRQIAALVGYKEASNG